MQIEHRGLCPEAYFDADFEKRKINAKFISEKASEARIKEIIVMVRKALGQAIDRTREEAEVVLEETENDELEELVNVADSILEQQTGTQIHPNNCQCGTCDGSGNLSKIKGF